MGELTLSQIIDYAGRIGVTSGSILLVVALVKGWLVPRYVLDDMREQRDRAVRRSENNDRVVDRSVSLSERGATAAERAAALAVEIIQRREHSTDTESDDAPDAPLPKRGERGDRRR